MREFYNFHSRSQEVRQIFYDLEKSDGKPGVEHLALNLRHAYNLPLPDNIEIVVEQPNEMQEVLEEAEVYDSETNEMEFGENEQVVFAETIIAEEEVNIGYEFEDYANESNLSQIKYEPDQIAEAVQEADEISKHFE